MISFVHKHLLLFFVVAMLMLVVVMMIVVAEVVAVVVVVVMAAMMEAFLVRVELVVVKVLYCTCLNACSYSEICGSVADMAQKHTNSWHVAHHYIIGITMLVMLELEKNIKKKCW